jgi:branched-chain amino acid transport system permease protein
MAFNWKKFDSWRSHPLLTKNMQHAFPGVKLGLAAFTAAVLGGIGNIRGAFAGGIALGLIEMYASAVLGTQWRSITAFVILILVLLFKPNGIFGESLQQARV